MTFVAILGLIIGLVITWSLLMDARRRLALVEQHLKEGRSPQLAHRIDESVTPAPVTVPDAIAEPAPEIVVSDPVAAEYAKDTAPPVPDEAVQAAPEPSLAYEPEPAKTTAPALRHTNFSFEDLFGRKLPIWAGGITLLVAAVLLVRYSIATGLLSPGVRVVLGAIFGFALIGGAEAARRKADLVQDPRIAQALAGAGIGSLYAATLAGSSLYGLIGPATAFAILAAITAAAIGLALRFGMPCAVLGLLGGLAAPALVQSEAPNTPMLAAYIALVVGGITLLSRREKWMWLGISALVGGAGWSMLMIALGSLDSFSVISVGLLVMVLGLGLPVLAIGDRGGVILRAAGAVVASLQLAAMVATAGFAPLTWGLYGLLSIAFVGMASRTPALRAYLAVPLMAAIALLAMWPNPGAALFATVLAGIVAIYGGPVLWQVRRKAALLDAGMLTAISLGGFAVCAWQFSLSDTQSVLLALGLAILPGAGAALTWLGASASADKPFALQAYAAALLVTAAALIALPEFAMPASFAVIAALTGALASRAGNRWLMHGALALLVCGVLSLGISGHSEAELSRLVMTQARPELVPALARWGILTASALWFAFTLAHTKRGVALQIAATVLGYGTLAQVIPAAWLGAVAALALLVLTEAARREPSRDMAPASATLALIACGWALDPLAQWCLAAIISLAGKAVLVTALPLPGTALRLLLLPALFTGIALWRRPSVTSASGGLALASAIIGAVALIGGHVLYKQLFHLASESQFVAQGLLERTIWEGLMIAAGAALWNRAHKPYAGLGLIAGGLIHALLYTVVLHDPLWAHQAVGALPVVNLLVPAYGVIFAALILTVRIASPDLPMIRRLADLVRIAVVPLFAYALLRQAFTGSVIYGQPVSDAENITRSLLAVLLAVGYLVWGIRTTSRDWRIASLVLMLAAIGKVFLFDASGLEGLARIGSFLALGFSLIGIGWLYSRYLRPTEGTPPDIALSFQYTVLNS